ncbi:methylmalonyl-CoA mutase family protein, partial [Flavobacteriales bacterium]|nr:methylmalonyl-CoA mutase family protein [Flavobacteriales bacterium]
WDSFYQSYNEEFFKFNVRDKELKIATNSKSLSNSKIPKVALPKFTSWGDIIRWVNQENVPGKFPFTAGLFPFKREGEDPTRMFAGEGGPERTNKRFHYLSFQMPAKRLSTAFDSVTLYGNDPGLRPDIFGKIGNAGVSICCLDDAKKLYSGFDLSSNTTSVSMTINGPAPMLLGFYMNAAIDQNCEKYIKKNNLENEVKKTIEKIYGTDPIPKYQGDLPKGNNGLGLMLLGVTGDQVLPEEVYNKIKDNTAGELHDKLMEIGSKLIIRTISEIESGTLKSKKQIISESQKTAPKLNRNNTRINWLKDDLTIKQFILGLNPYPGAWTLLSNNGRELNFKIFNVRTSNLKVPKKTILLKENKLYIGTNTNALELLEIQLEGKKKMHANDFIKGNKNIDQSILL